jgi:predicted phage-related endonuclease
MDWPRLTDLRMSGAEAALRSECIGGSDANIIMSGSSEAVLRLWREKRGEGEPEDLSSKLPVMLGCWTEAFNRQWYEQATREEVSVAGMTLRCSTYAWRRCTLDGFVEARGAVWEAKHTSAFAKNEEVLARYMPQLQHNMAVAKAERALLSVIFGNHKWEVFEVASDWLYQDELLTAEELFWQSVQNGNPPEVAAPVPPPKPVGVREICLEGNNLWAANAADWLENRDAARRHASASAALRDMLEPDVSRAFGHGIEAKRSKAGAVTIRELTK